MRHAVWTSILDAWDRANTRCDRDLPPKAPPPKAPPAKALGAKRLGELRAHLEETLEGLERSLLLAQVTKAVVCRIRFPLTLHLDELVLSRLVHADRLDWSRLQKDLLPSELGGEAFFTQLDKLLDQPAEGEGPVVLQVYYFCLDRGFRGRIDDTVFIDAYKTRIRTHLERGGLEAPPPSTSGAKTSQPQPPPPQPRSRAFWYVVMTAVAVTVILTLPIALSNL